MMLDWRRQRAAGLGDGLAAGDALAPGDAAGEGLAGGCGLTAGVGSGVLAGGFGVEHALATRKPAAANASSPYRAARDARTTRPVTKDDDIEPLPSWDDFATPDAVLRLVQQESQVCAARPYSTDSGRRVVHAPCQPP